MGPTIGTHDDREREEGNDEPSLGWRNHPTQLDQWLQQRRA